MIASASPSTRPAPPPFDPVFAARGLLRAARRASLATLVESGAPYVSLIGMATDGDGAPLLLVSDLARHTRNLKRESRASVLLADVGAGDPLAHPRVTLIGTTREVDKAAGKERWLARQPESAMYYDFADFRMLRLEPEGGHLVAGFGRIVDLAWDALAAVGPAAEALAQAEAGIVAHMNEDHADATRLYATKLLGAPDGEWSFQGVDPFGCELGLAGRALYLPFDEPAASAGDVRKRLVELVVRARAA